MRAVDLTTLLADLAVPGDRSIPARRVAAALGAEDLMVLLRDAETDVYLPSLGLRKTLPGGPQWRALLADLRHPGIHRAQVPAFDAPVEKAAVACSIEGASAVLLGGRVRDKDAKLVRALLPMLAFSLRTEKSLAIAVGELTAARFELQQSASLMQALDEARAEVDRTLVKVDAQARSLQHARAQAEEATLAKDRFMAMLGHELRNPLSPIVTALELLRHRGVWSPEHDIMQRQVAQLMRLVDDLLDVSRITGGKLELKLGPLDIADVIGRALEMTKPLFNQRRHRLEVVLPESGLWVSGDAGRLAQVFSNLLTNACKYSDPGTQITVTARRVENTCVVQFADQGIGIDPDMLETVFDLFEQQGRGLDRAQGGLGLGLAIVRNLVLQHGGKVHAHSDGRGLGSRFVVELPLLSTEARETAHDEPALSIPPDMHGNILLVDDNSDAAATLAMALRLVGFDVRTAGDGLAALGLLDDFEPDVALLDIGLPVMDGYELAGKLRERCGRTIRLVALTGYGQPADRLRAETSGFDAHLVKPVDFTDVLTTLTHMLGAPTATKLPR